MMRFGFRSITGRKEEDRIGRAKAEAWRLSLVQAKEK